MPQTTAQPSNTARLMTATIVPTWDEKWTKNGHLPRLYRVRTKWIWRLHADAHDYRTQDTRLLGLSARIFASHFGHLSLVFAWFNHGQWVHFTIAALRGRTHGLGLCHHLLWAGWFHYHRAVPSLSWFSDIDSALNHHLAGLFGLGSIAWAGA